MDKFAKRNRLFLHSLAYLFIRSRTVFVFSNLLKYYSASHLDECGNPMDYDVIWESKEIEDCKNGDIATLKKRKEVIEFLNSLRKVDKVENIK